MTFVNTPSHVLWKDHILRGLSFGFERKFPFGAVLSETSYRQRHLKSPKSKRSGTRLSFLSSLSSLLRAF
jgi:hypothetical protein